MCDARTPIGNAEEESPKLCDLTTPMAGEGVGLLCSVPRHWRLAHLCTACSVLAATSGLQGGWENASLCLQIFTRISVVFFAFVTAICLCFLRLFLCCFIFLFLLLKEEQAFLCLSDVQHISRSMTQARSMVSKPSYCK